MLDINSKEAKELIAQESATKTASVIGRFENMAQISVSAEAAKNGEKLAAEHIENVRNTALPAAMAVAIMMAKTSSEDEGPVIKANAEKLAAIL